jgi:hypothetical protein
MKRQEEEHMSKKVLIISGSPRVNGNSEMLCDQFAKGASEAGHEAEKISLAGKKIGFCLGEITLEAAERVYISNSGGYIFPCPNRLTVGFYENGGVRFVSLRIEHGIDPENEKYAYILLPNASFEELEAYDASDIEILRNDGQIQAAHERSSGLCGIVFRENAYFEGVRADQPMIVMMRRRFCGEIDLLTACDPTQKLESFSFALENADNLSSSDECVAVSQDFGMTKFTVNCDSARGRGYSAQKEAL